MGAWMIPNGQYSQLDNLIKKLRGKIIQEDFIPTTTLANQVGQLVALRILNLDLLLSWSVSFLVLSIGKLPCPILCSEL